MEKLTRTFPAPKGVREFKTITIQEVDGNDEIQAAEWAGQRGADDSTSQFKELVRASIVAVDGKPFNVKGVANREFDGWRTKARNAVVRFFNELNGLDPKDLDTCVAKGMGLLPAPTPNEAQAPSDSTETLSGG